MRSLFTAIAILLFSSQNAFAIADSLRLRQRDNSDQYDMSIEVPFPGNNALLGLDISDTNFRDDGGTGTFAVMYLGTGLSYNHSTHTISATAAGSRTFNYPTRALNSCFQISTTQDADFRYTVDVSTGLSLTSGATGTVAVTSYTNSGCTTGAQLLADGTAGQSGALVVGLGVNQLVSVPLVGIAQKNTWLKITTANTTGTPTFSLRASQAEVLLP